MGNGLSSILLLGITTALGLLKDATNPSQTQLYAYFGSIIVVLILCLVVFLVLMNSSMFNKIMTHQGKSSTDQQLVFVKPKQCFGFTKTGC